MLTSEKLADMEDDIDSIMESIVANNRSVSNKITSQQKSRYNYEKAPIKERNRVDRMATKTRTDSKLDRTTRNTSSTESIRSRRLSQQIDQRSRFKASSQNSDRLTTTRRHSMQTMDKFRDIGITSPASAAVYFDSDKLNEKYQKQSNDRENSQRYNKPIIKKTVSIIIIATSLLIVPVLSFTVFRSSIVALLKPRTPFTNELQQNMRIPLYYPTNLPPGYKIETNSITQPQSGVIIYAVTNDSAKKINISLQKQPSSIDMSSIYQTLKNINEIETKFGTVKYGDSDQNMTLVNVMTGQGMIIITLEPNQITQEQLKSIINSFVY